MDRHGSMAICGLSRHLHAVHGGSMARSRRRIRHVRQLRDAAEAPRGPRAAAARGQGDAKLVQEPHDVTPEELGGDFSRKTDEN